MKKEEFVKAMTFLGNAYSKELSESELTTWYLFMKDYQYGEFLEAIKHIVKTNKYFPSISEICETISIDDVSEAEYKFESVRHAIRKFGSISTYEAFVYLGCTRLSEYIRQLRITFDIDDTWIKTTNRFGKKIRYKKYFLKEEGK